MEYNDPRMVLVTGQHCITESVRAGMDALFRDPNYQARFSGTYIDFDTFVVTNTWDAEPYIIYEGDVPVGIAKPTFDRQGRRVTNILPRIFPAYRRMGYGSFIFEWAIPHYFKQGFEKISTMVWSNNIPSLELNRKFLEEEAVLPKHQLNDGHRYDAHLFGLVRSDI